MKKIASLLIVICATFGLSDACVAAPCYGTKMPEGRKFFAGVENYTIFKRALEADFGKIKSQQQFLLISYGVFDGLSLDLKCGVGNIKQYPEGANEVRYGTNFAGGYGLRLRIFEKGNLKSVLGFQHISVHPCHTTVGGDKNRAILDDWQGSWLVSYDCGRMTPYIGARWSETDYIHAVDNDRNRIQSDPGKSIGLIVGFDVPVKGNTWINIEGSFFDNEAIAVSFNFGF